MFFDEATSMYPHQIGRRGQDWLYFGADGTDEDTGTLPILRHVQTGQSARLSEDDTRADDWEVRVHQSWMRP